MLAKTKIAFATALVLGSAAAALANDIETKPSGQKQRYESAFTSGAYKSSRFGIRLRLADHPAPAEGGRPDAGRRPGLSHARGLPRLPLASPGVVDPQLLRPRHAVTEIGSNESVASARCSCLPGRSLLL